MQDPAVDDDIHMPIAVVNGKVFELCVLLMSGNKALNNGLFKTLSLSIWVVSGPDRHPAG
jgi:hypothetical protein